MRGRGSRRARPGTRARLALVNQLLIAATIVMTVLAGRLIAGGWIAGYLAGLVLLAATNRPEILDPALLRPGRFDRQILVDRPDVREREEILKVHTRNIKLDPKADIKLLATRTPGFVGADLANVVNEAALLAARSNKDHVEMDDFEEAINRMTTGL